jgi:apolipoprotein N-acyltransferase
MDVVVWPEAAVPDALPAAEVDARLKALARDLDCVLLTGYGRDDPAAGRSYNSLMAVTPDGASNASYDKVRLAAFGEYVPFGEYLPFLEAIAFGGVSAGEEQRLLPTPNLQIGPLICFEVLFSGMSRNLRTMGADCLLVVTNLAWFGASNAVMQELEIARFRAIESRLPLIHCSNTGISGVFDPFGRFHPLNMQYFSGGQARPFEAERYPVGAGMSRRLVGILDIPGKGSGCTAPWWGGTLAFLSVLALSLLWGRVRPSRGCGEST